MLKLCSRWRRVCHYSNSSYCIMGRRREILRRPRIPVWWRWYYWACPVAWTIYGLILSQYGDSEDPITAPGMANCIPINEYLHAQYGYESDFMAPIAGVLVGFAVFFGFMFAYYIKTLNFQTR